MTPQSLFLSQELQSVSLLFNNAEIKALPTTGNVLLVQAQPGKIIVPVLTTVIGSFPTAYTNIHADAFMALLLGDTTATNLFFNDSSIPAAILSSFFNIGIGPALGMISGPGAPFDIEGWGLVPRMNELVTYENVDLNFFIDNDSGNFTGGEAANWLKIIVKYLTMDV